MNTKYLTIEEFGNKARAYLDKFVKHEKNVQTENGICNNVTLSEEDWYDEFSHYVIEQDNKYE